jgi:hypothetical protein
MIFGLSHAERYKKQLLAEAAKDKWVKTFAILPVQLDTGEWLWLEYVEVKERGFLLNIYRRCRKAA